jgi:hypothetical protein
VLTPGQVGSSFFSSICAQYLLPDRYCPALISVLFNARRLFELGHIANSESHYASRRRLSLSGWSMAKVHNEILNQQQHITD